VLKVMLVHKELLALKGLQDLLDLRVLLAHKVPKVLRAMLGLKA
jgi:hypothetical protein